MIFQEIWEAVQQGVGKGTNSELPMIKTMVNMVYLSEVMNADELYPLFWMVNLVDNRRTVNGTVITAITKADPGVITAASHGLVAGDIFTIYNVSGMTEVNAMTVKAGSASTTNTLAMINPDTGANINTSGFSTYTSGGNVVHRGITLDSNIDTFFDLSFDDENNEDLKDISIKELRENPIWWTDQTSRPKRWMHKKAFTNSGTEYDQLWWFPGADATYNLRQWVQKQPTRLSSGTDVPMIPGKFHEVLVAGAITRLAENSVQVENAVVWPNIYTAQIEAFVSYNRRYWRRFEQSREKASFF